jgi:radical SAM-linked protein
MRIRITFSKQGVLRYTSHLDLHKIWERAARRADLPLAYSQGFHPAPRISIASALPLGFSACAEVLDLWLNFDLSLEHIRTRLMNSLPSGVEVLDIDRVDDQAPALQTQVVAAEYKVKLTTSEPETDIKQRVDDLLHAETLPRQRHGKFYDLRPLIEDLSITTSAARSGSPHRSSAEGEEQGLQIFMRLSVRPGATGRPEEVLTALEIPPESTQIERTRLFFI